MVDAGDGCDVLDVVDESVERRLQRIDEAVEEVDADHAAGPRDALEPLVGEVAVMRLDRERGRVRGHHRPCRELEHMVGAARGQM